MANPLVDRLRVLDSCAISDALDSLDLPPAIVGLKPLTVQRRIAGSVVTVKLGPEPPAGGPTRHLGTAAIEAADFGDVIAIEHSSGIECAGWGGVLSIGAQLRGIQGVVIDGPVRDIDEARGLGFPIYARSAIARTARGRAYEQDFDCPITIGGIDVESRDLVLADASGVVVVPKTHVYEVLVRAERIMRREKMMVEALRRGEKITDVVGGDYETMLDELEKLE